MDEPVKLPPRSKAYYRSAADGEWQELGTVAGVDMGEVGGDYTTFNTVIRVSTEGEPLTADTTALRKQDAASREPVKCKPAVARHVAGRNEQCPCGSGRKYKKCHLGRSMASLVVPSASIAPAAPASP